MYSLFSSLCIFSRRAILYYRRAIDLCIFLVVRPCNNIVARSTSVFFSSGDFVLLSRDRSVHVHSVVVTAYDFESGRRGSTLGTMQFRTRAEHKGCNWVIDGCSLALCSATVSVASAGICHRNKVNSLSTLDGLSQILYTYYLYVL